jgi:hypothetical protein
MSQGEGSVDDREGCGEEKTGASGSHGDTGLQAATHALHVST